MTNGPEPTEFDIGCFFHGLEGDVTPEKQPYRTCGECGHISWTAEQLVEEFNSTQREAAEGCGFSADDVIEELDPEKIYFCAWCAHDF